MHPEWDLYGTHIKVLTTLSQIKIRCGSSSSTMIGMDFMLNRQRRYVNPTVAARIKKKPSGDSSNDTWRSKAGWLVFEKFLLVLVTTVSIYVFQTGMQRSEERLEKARHIGEILVDKPVSIVADLPAHLDAFILYAEHIRSYDLEEISSARLTELQATIRSDIEGSRAYYADDPDLKQWAVQIKDTIKAVRAKALSKNSLGKEDIEKLEDARDLAYLFHRQIIRRSVREAKEAFDTAGERPQPH